MSISDANDSVNDGVIVTVHAPEGDFTDEDQDNYDSGDEDNGVIFQAEQEDLMGFSDDEDQSSQETEPDSSRSGNPKPAKKFAQSEEEMMEMYENNPVFMKIVQNMVTKTISGSPEIADKGQGEECVSSKEPQISSAIVEGTPNRIRQDQNSKTNETSNKSRLFSRNNDETNMVEKLKSPSDTTIYAPGLRRCEDGRNSDNFEMIEKILNFVESV